jgi:hypothetical protein
VLHAVGRYLRTALASGAPATRAAA